MSDNKRPTPDSPEFERWLIERAKKRAERIFNVEIPNDLAHVDSGIMTGPRSWEDVMPEKTIAEDIAIDKAHKRMHLKVVNDPIAKVSLLKKELAALIAIVEAEKRRYDAIDYKNLSDDEAGDTGDEHETIDGILSMLKASYTDTLE